MNPRRIRLAANGTALPGEPEANKKASAKYPRVPWGHFYKPCAVVGGGFSIHSRLDMLRKWEGDIFSINDTTEYLSNNGIASFLYAIDTTSVSYRVGSLVRGALLASRVNPAQFEVMKDKPIFVFDLAEEDNKNGIPGGPTAVCRTPYLLGRMGYKSITYFGIEGSFDPQQTHVSGFSSAAYDNMIIVNAGGNKYYSNAGFYLQNFYMTEIFTDPITKKFCNLESDGLLKAMIENPDTWEVVAIADDLREKYGKNGYAAWNTKYDEGSEVWRPQAALLPQPLSKLE